MSATPDHASTPTIRDAARAAIERAWAEAARSGALPLGPDAVQVDVEVERPAKAEHGDLATSLPLRLARPLRMAPGAIAEAIAGALVAAVEAADDGAPSPFAGPAPCSASGLFRSRS